MIEYWTVHVGGDGGKHFGGGQGLTGDVGAGETWRRAEQRVSVVYEVGGERILLTFVEDYGGVFRCY